MKQVLLFGYGSQEEAACAVIRQQGCTARVVQAQEMDQKIGYLCGLPGYHFKKPREEKPVHPGALMVFQDLTHEELEQLLQALRAASVTVRSVKAMVTPTNREWTLRHLGDEVREEHEVMKILIQLKKLRDQLPMPQPTDFRLVAALMKAEELLSGTREVSLEEAQQAQQMLLAAAAEKL